MKPDRIYHADAWSYVVWLGLLGLPLVPMVFILTRSGWTEFQSKGMTLPASVILVAIAIAAGWLSRYRLVFGGSAISYRSWRGSWSFPYAQIDGVCPSRVTPISRYPIGAYVQTKDGRRFLIYTKVFSRSAISDLFSLDASI